MNHQGTTISFDKGRGEIRILGRRHLAIDAEGFCTHLNQLVGLNVAEVIIKQHEYRLGKEDAEQLRKQKPNATLRDIIDIVEQSDRDSGVGITRVTLPNSDTQPLQAIPVEIANPCVKITVGAGKSFFTSYWAGLMSYFLGKECDYEEVSYDKPTDILRFRIVVRK